jgi:hypothetical protein
MLRRAVVHLNEDLGVSVAQLALPGATQQVGRQVEIIPDGFGAYA